jgi:ABC-type Fe3+/spermidine/putrescine transport system ATPase subunit
MSLFQLQNITKSFGKIVLQDVSLAVNRGDTFGLLGESGSGKSTLLRIAAGLTDADSGMVLLKNKAIAPAYDKLIPGHADIKIVHQDYELFAQLTVKENISYALRFYEKQYQQARTQELIELCHLESVAIKPAKLLSGGEKQRTAIAKAIAEKPKVLLLDEPFAHLDLLNRNRLSQSIQRLVSQMGLACIFVTHDAPNALALSNKMGVLKDGILLQIDTPENIYHAPNNAYIAELTGEVTILKVSFINKIFGVPPTHSFSDRTTAIRPENILIERLPSDNSIEATVKQVVFGGSHYKIQVMIDKQKIWGQSPQKPVEGQIVFVSLR